MAHNVIFSFTSYANSIITTLKSSAVHVATGLSDAEISTVEYVTSFTFPPDLRSILSTGLPMGPGFPNWRSPSPYQLRLLSSLPILSLAKQVSRNNFWPHTLWGPRPTEPDEALSLARTFLGRAPPLVPIYRYCYVPSQPNLAGNPVFYVHGGDVRLVSRDIATFFKETHFWRSGFPGMDPGLVTTSRTVEFWSDVAARECNRGQWWTGKLQLGGCLEKVMWRLRDGGWGEEDVKDMLMIDGGDDDVLSTRLTDRVVMGGNREGVVRHVRSLSRELLRSGWSIDDVVYSMGDLGNERVELVDGILEEESWVEFHYPFVQSRFVSINGPGSS